MLTPRLYMLVAVDYMAIRTGPVYNEKVQSTGSEQKDTCITNPHYESLHLPRQIATLVSLSNLHYM